VALASRIDRRLLTFSLFSVIDADRRCVINCQQTSSQHTTTAPYLIECNFVLIVANTPLPQRSTLYACDHNTLTQHTHTPASAINEAALGAALRSVLVALTGGETLVGAAAAPIGTLEMKCAIRSSSTADELASRDASACVAW
jgi:hypothetical protein